MKNVIRAGSLALALTVATAACASDEDTDETTTTVAGDEETTTTEAATGEETPGEETPGEETEAVATVVDVALSNPDFSILVAALTEAELVETLQGDGPFTVFAPTDEAFEAAGITADSLPDKEALVEVLTYHVVPSKILAADAIAADGTDVQTVLETGTVAVSVDGESVKINDATVVTADVEADNGVVHVIDKVLTVEAAE